VDILRNTGIAAMVRPSDASSLLGIAAFGCRVQVAEEDLDIGVEVGWAERGVGTVVDPGRETRRDVDGAAQFGMRSPPEAYKTDIRARLDKLLAATKVEAEH
jgi:hypothetical protein